MSASLDDPVVITGMARTPMGGFQGDFSSLSAAQLGAVAIRAAVLDEPTNDLDMDTLDMLEEILINYDGTLFIVSHDRDFLDQTVTKILAFEGEGKVEGYIGGYSDYLEASGRAEKKAEATTKTKKDSPKPPETGPRKTAPQKRLSYKLQYELDHLPDRIKAIELEIDSIVDRLSDPEFYSRDPGAFHSLSRNLVHAREELNFAELRWLELEEMRESIQ